MNTAEKQNPRYVAPNPYACLSVRRSKWRIFKDNCGFYFEQVRDSRFTSGFGLVLGLLYLLIVVGAIIELSSWHPSFGAVLLIFVCADLCRRFSR
jgi:hypothetical protein